MKITNEGLTREEFLQSFRKVIDHILNTEVKLIGKIDDKTKEEIEKLRKLSIEFDTVIERAKKDSDNTFSSFKKRAFEAINKLFSNNEVNKKLSDKLKEANDIIVSLEERLGQIKDGRDGVDGVDGVDGKEAEPVNEDKILKRLVKRLPKIDKSELKDLRDEVRVLRRMRRGGGTSAMGIANAAKYFVKTEAPSGAINGSNTAYTVDHTIFAILAFSLNGEVIAQIPNYTIAGKTITFSTALPSAYSGRDFEVKYI